MRTHGIAASTVYSTFRAVVQAINRHPALAIECDNSEDALRERAGEFALKCKSAPDLFKYCTGAIDGLAIHIKCPKRSKTKHQIRYFSGNKQKYCLNMQAVCDARCRFLAMTCNHVGSTNDGVAFCTSSLKALCQGQQFPYHWNGDIAYPLLESLHTPYLGLNLHETDPFKESYNYFHSELRITIERCFGMFVRRWGIFHKALEYDLSFVTEIVHACCRLHNFIIDFEAKEKYESALFPAAVHANSATNDNFILNNAAHWQTGPAAEDEEDEEEEEGVVDEPIHYAVGAQPLNLQNDDEEAGLGCCALRERLLSRIEAMDLRVIRSHHHA
eukprot:gene31290-37817_t